MPRWPAKSKAKLPKAKTVAPRKRRRKNTPGVVDDIPSISRSQLIRSSISPRSSSEYKDRVIEVERGTTLIIKIV